MPSARPRKVFLTVTEACKRYKHGTNARYHLGRCRCTSCRQAAQAYANALALRKAPWRARYSRVQRKWLVENAATKEIRYAVVRESTAERHVTVLNADAAATDPNALVPIREVREHLAWLQKQGVGLQTCARAAGITQSVVHRMAEGKIKRTRRSTAAKILGVSEEAIKGGARIRADETLVLIARLVKAGYTRGWLATELGSKTKVLQIGKTSPWVKVSKAKAVHALYVRLQKRDRNLLKIDASFQLSVAESTHTRSGHKPTGPATQSTRQRNFAHGTRSRYTELGCRCTRCREANAAYEKARREPTRARYLLRETRDKHWIVRDVVTGSVAFRSNDRTAAVALRDQFNLADPIAGPNALVDVTPVRDHVVNLAGVGIGVTTIAKAAGTNGSHIWHILHGRSQRIHKRLADALLAVDEHGKPARAMVDAAPVWAMIDRLETVGFQRAWIARLTQIDLGSLRARRPRLRVYRARAVISLYATLRERISALRDFETHLQAA